MASFDAPSRRWSPSIVVTVVVVVAGLVLCAVPVFGFVVYMYLGPDIDDAKAAASTYLTRIEANDDAGAYAMVCSQAQASTSLSQFSELVDSATRPVKHDFGRAAFSDEPGHRAHVPVQLTDRAGTIRHIDLEVSDYEARTWKVCGDTLV